MGYWVEYKEEGTEAWVKVRTLIDIMDSDAYMDRQNCLYSLHVHLLFSGQGKGGERH